MPENRKRIEFARWKNILVLVIVAAVIIFVLISKLTGSWHRPLDNLFKGISENNTSAYTKSMPDCQINYYSNMIKDYDDYKTVDDFLNYRLDFTIKKLEKIYGNDLKASYSVNSRNTLESDDLEKIRSELCDEYDCKNLNITKGYALEINAEFKGSEKSGNQDMKIQVAEVNDKWCVINDLPID